MPSDVFISYSSEDKLTADACCAILESQGIRCWIAPRDISLGADWTESIIAAIESVSLMVLIFSKAANESRQIKREVNIAIDCGVTVIPVRVENVTPSKSLKYSISINHWLDAFPPPHDLHFRKLTEQIQAYLNTPGNRKPGPAQAESDPVKTENEQPKLDSISSTTLPATANLAAQESGIQPGPPPLNSPEIEKLPSLHKIESDDLPPLPSGNDIPSERARVGENFGAAKVDDGSKEKSRPPPPPLFTSPSKVRLKKGCIYAIIWAVVIAAILLVLLIIIGAHS